MNAHRLLSSSCVQRFRVYAAFCYVYSLIRMKSRNHTRPWPLFFRINQLARSRTQPLWYAAKTNPETGMKTNSSNANCGAINVAVDFRTTIVTTCALLQPRKGSYNDANRICKSDRHSSIPAFQHSSIPAFQHSSIPAFQHSSIPHSSRSNRTMIPFATATINKKANQQLTATQSAVLCYCSLGPSDRRESTVWLPSFLHPSIRPSVRPSVNCE